MTRSALWLALAAGLAGSVLAVVRAGDAPVTGTARLPYELVFVAAGLLCVLRGRRRPGRRAWTLLGAAVLVMAAADTYRLVAQPTSVPSPADVGFLAFYPLTYVGLVLLVRARTRRWPASTMLDGLVAGLGLATVTAAVAYGPVVLGGGPVPALVVALAYPLGDLALLTIVGVLVVLLGQRPERDAVALTAAFGLVAVTDTLYLAQAFSGDGLPAAWTDLFWLAAASLVPVAAWTPPAPPRPDRPAGQRVLLIPGLATLAAIAVLALPVPPVATVLATATLLTAVARTGLTFRDVRAAAEDRQLAVTDELTGLGNRRLFAEACAAALEQPGRTALLLVDLDRFKEVNDALGHSVGDRLLRELGPRLVARMRAGETIARLGGDEFGVLVPGGGDPEAVAARIAGALDEPFHIAGVDVQLAASIGIAVAPDHGTDAEVLLRKADVAMYEAKRTGAGLLTYTPAADRNTRERLQTATDLRRALERSELVCHYQPQVDLATGLVTGAEALVRWVHPERGVLSPAHFLRLAEQLGLMRPLTEIVLTSALAACRDWATAGTPIGVSVNLTADGLLDRRLVGRLAELLDAAGLPSKQLTLEVTEESLLGDPDRVRRTMLALRVLGVEISIDDYGAGYSSLAYLRELPVDELKLDRALVMPLERDPRAAAIVASTIDLAHALGVRLVAEGVEDEAALTALRRLGCDRVQGFHLARPMRGEEIPAWVRTWEAARAPVRT